ncbi:MAG: hypothetical protein GC200_09445 [Tepidisphaera sp.]|nr:hypothetical protein [Tepidisphaera sp.]
MNTAAANPKAWMRAALYPSLYVWYIFAASLDVLLTYAFIYRIGGEEVNLIAARLVERYEHWGLIGLKYSSVILVIGVCEVVGRRNLRTGRLLAIVAIVISAFPVGYGLLQLLAWLHFGGPGPENIPLE